jgi:hypothetical protein
MAFLAFWVSLRSQDDQVMYTIIALIVWGVAFLANRWLKDEKDQKEE